MGSPTDVALLSRRLWLKGGLLGAAAFGLGGAALALQDTVLRPLPAGGLAVLTAQEYAVLAAVADRLHPALGEGAPGASALDVARRADALLAAGPRPAQRDVKLLLRLFESPLMGVAFGERVAPFTQLPAARQDAVLAAWRDSSVAFRRVAYKALAALCAALYFGDRRTWARTGYPGPPSPRALRVAYQFNLVDFSALRPRADEGR